LRACFEARQALPDERRRLRERVELGVELVDLGLHSFNHPDQRKSGKGPSERRSERLIARYPRAAAIAGVVAAMSATMITSLIGVILGTTSSVPWRLLVLIRGDSQAYHVRAPWFSPGHAWSDPESVAIAPEKSY
jgi:hypothetical protein